MKSLGDMEIRNLGGLKLGNSGDVKFGSKYGSTTKLAYILTRAYLLGQSCEAKVQGAKGWALPSLSFL